MDLRQYFGERRAKEAELDRSHPDGIIHVTSLFYREKNSTPGKTLSATCHNAARVITDGTHREATPEEVDNFLRHQQNELRRNSASEQKNKRQYIVVVDQHDQLGALEPALAGAASDAGRASLGSKGRPLVNKE